MLAYGLIEIFDREERDECMGKKYKIPVRFVCFPFIRIVFCLGDLISYTHNELQQIHVSSFACVFFLLFFDYMRGGKGYVSFRRFVLGVTHNTLTKTTATSIFLNDSGVPALLKCTSLSSNTFHSFIKKRTIDLNNSLFERRFAFL